MLKKRTRPLVGHEQSLVRRIEANKSTRGWNEATGLVVEAAEVIFKVDVEPFAARAPRLPFRYVNEICSDPAPPKICRDHRVLDPGMHESVPDHVHEAHQ